MGVLTPHVRMVRGSSDRGVRRHSRLVLVLLVLGADGTVQLLHEFKCGAIARRDPINPRF